MTHKDIFQKFKELFPNYEGGNVVCFRLSKNSIRVRNFNMDEFIFSYNGPDDWKFETVKSYNKTMKGE